MMCSGAWAVGVGCVFSDEFTNVHGHGARLGLGHREMIPRVTLLCPDSEIENRNQLIREKRNGIVTQPRNAHAHSSETL
jgi:hypothetical protein